MSLVTRLTVWQAGHPIVGKVLSWFGFESLILLICLRGLTNEVINQSETTIIDAPPINTGG